MTRFSRLALVAAVVPLSLSAQAPATKLGFSTTRLARIDTFLQSAVDRNEIGGAVAMVLRDGQPVYSRAFGWSDREANRRMTTDAMFRIASQSKAVTSVAIMALVEEGKIALNDPVSRFIPAFQRTTVATRSDTGRVIVRARRGITIRDLLMHTAGISYGTDSLLAPLYREKGLGSMAGPQGWYFANKNEPICDVIERLATLPFTAQPGERFVYGYNTDILGCVVERVSGVTLDEFIRARITRPLGMRDTHFFPPREEALRVVTVYASGANNQITRAPDGPPGQGDYIEGPRRTFSGGAGLVSTAGDYARFLQMLLNGGVVDGARILAPKTVDLMTASTLIDSVFTRFGEGFSLGFRTLDRAGASGRVESVGTFGWGGAYGSQYFVDPKERLVLVFMLNQIPNRSDVAAKFPMLVYQALIEPRQPK